MLYFKRERNYLKEPVLRDVQERRTLLSLTFLLHSLRHETPKLVHIDDRAMELVHGLVKVPHTDLAEVTRMVLVEQDTVMVHTSGVTTTSRMLAVLADTSMTGTHVTSLLPVLLQPGRHGSRKQINPPSNKSAKEKEREGPAGFTPYPNSLLDDICSIASVMSRWTRR